MFIHQRSWFETRAVLRSAVARPIAKKMIIRNYRSSAQARVKSMQEVVSQTPTKVDIVRKEKMKQSRGRSRSYAI